MSDPTAHDDTAALQALLDDPPDGGYFRAAGRITLEPRTYRISETLRITRRSVVLRGQGVSVLDKGGTTLLWAGPPGVPMIRLNQTMHCRIEDLRLAGNSGSRPSAAISFMQAAQDVLLVEGNMVRNVFIGGMFGWDADQGIQFEHGILFEGMDVNDDFTTFENLTIYRCQVGIRVGTTMACGQDFRNIRIYQCDVGVIDHSMNVYTNVYQGDCRVNYLVQGAGNITLLGCTSEGAERFLVFDGQGGSLTAKGGGFQAGAKFAADGIVIDGYTPSPITVALEDFHIYRLGATAVPRIRLRSDPAGSEGRKTFLGRNLINFGPENLDMAVSGPKEQYPQAQRYIEFNVRGMHNSPDSKPAGTFRNIVEAGGTVDLTRYDTPGKPPPPVPDVLPTLRVADLIVTGAIRWAGPGGAAIEGAGGELKLNVLAGSGTRGVSFGDGQGTVRHMVTADGSPLYTHLADAKAPNNSLYFGAQHWGWPCYKDGYGTVYVLTFRRP